MKNVSIKRFIQGCVCSALSVWSISSSSSAQAWGAEVKASSEVKSPEVKAPEVKTAAKTQAVKRPEAQSKPLTQPAPKPTDSENKTASASAPRLGRGLPGSALFLRSQIGFALTFAEAGAPRRVSTPAPYIGLHVGYFVNRFAGISLHVTSAFAENAALTASQSEGVTDFSMTHLAIGPHFEFTPHERLALTAAAGIGISVLWPIPLGEQDQGRSAAPVQPELELTAGLSYRTPIQGLSLGLDLTFHTILRAKINTLALSPTLSYRF